MIEGRAVFLYGSYARGDADEFSDVDILAISPNKPDHDEISTLLSVSLPGPLNISHYTWTEFESMGSYGSLFLHHIAVEAKVLHYEGDAKKRLSKTLDSLPAYQYANRDLNSFRSMIDDVQKGLSVGIPTGFELSVLGGIARHASILVCYLAGIPTFGRNCIARAVEALQMPEVLRMLQLAHSYRLYEERRCGTVIQITREDVEEVVVGLRNILDRLERLIYANA